MDGLGLHEDWDDMRTGFIKAPKDIENPLKLPCKNSAVPRNG
jgi:hypothetical protein